MHTNIYLKHVYVCVHAHLLLKNGFKIIQFNNLKNLGADNLVF